MPDIDKLNELKEYCNNHNVKLVAVSKTKSNAEILATYKAKHKIYGENKVQEMVPKYESLPRDIQWHLVGHLQRNKVKYIAPFVSLIHSMDSIRLCKEIDKQGRNAGRVQNCLIQVHIAEEETKHGFSQEDLEAFFNSDEYKNMEYVRIKGLMGIATNTGDEEQIRKEFRWLADLHKTLKANYFSESKTFTELSMGMTNDYQIAVEEGSTMVRIGSLIFGERDIA